ncbi:hypothetical protein PAERUG_P53_London_9_VIM_2_02_13_03226 [Pseudomonas aeruginosa]|nr:hypothetical protein PAERUG_P20_London_17_VIM_2_05_10_00392 [Pseudomonas aeruginosa]CRN40607.1 hypothetical protein PAERUG_P17_North_West_14_VIM_2_03_10_01030 [Pseudomonas aeruginosa]CRN74197.1 hypothetical protein PAERUG_E11_London_26_VIM_2_06_13_00404 [Pseudomonas aeruginosa]CRO80253.1 hypothetical protein PAERUG_P1_London_28_IMP_1_04_05_02377 [Pseudomonas aeruginosa]CRW98536.1 hypothetical protein PAERUG_P53_London_9_VIM_2_02_13_03226 [Pseudomonas aeruginosa]
MADLGLVAVLPGELDRDHLADLHGRTDRHIDLDAVADLRGVDPGIGGFRHADGRRRQVRRVDGGRPADVAGGVHGNPGDQFAGDQRRRERQAEVAGAVDGDRDRVGGVAVDHDTHLTVRLGGAGQQRAVGADAQQRSGRRHRVHRGAGRTAGVARGVFGDGVDHRTVGQRRAGGEGPVATAVGGGLADRVAVAVGEDHFGADLGGAGDHAAVAGIDHRRGRRHRIHRGAGRTAGIAGRVLGHGVDHRAVGQRRARCEGPVAATVGEGLADRVAIAIGEDHPDAGFGGAAEFDTIARVDHRGGRGHRVHRGADRTAGVAGGVLGHRIDHRAVGQRCARSEAPVAAAIGGGLPYRVAAAVGEDHRGPGFGGTADHRTVARIEHRGGRGYRVHRGAGRAAGVAGGVLGQRIDHRAVGQRRAGREAPVAAAVGGDLPDRVAVAVGEDHRGPGFRRTADDDSVARIDHRRRRGDGIDGDAGRTAGIAGRVLGHGVDHGAVGQRGARGERPVAAAVGGGLADRVAAAIGEDHRRASFRGTAYLGAVARIDHRRRRGHAIHSDHRRRTVDIAWAARHHVDHRAIRQRDAWSEGPVAAAVGGDLANRVAVAIGDDDGVAGVRGAADHRTVARIHLRDRRQRGIHRRGSGSAGIAGGVARGHVDHGAVG